MDEAITDFLTYLRDVNQANLTVQRYGDLLRRFHAFVRNELHVESINIEQIDKALVTLFVREGGRPGAVASPSTRNTRLAALRRFLRFLVDEERLAGDPSRTVQFAKLPSRQPTYLTESEFNALCRTIEREATEHYLHRDLAIVIALFHTGLRLSELVSLNLAQVDFAEERFNQVRRKGGEVADVHFNVEVTIALRRWCWARLRYPGAAESRALFLSDRGGRLSGRAVEDLLEKYVKAAGISKRVTPHVLRHSFATALHDGGVDILVISRLLGHRSLRTTELYAHSRSRQLHDAVASLAGTSRRSAER